MPANEKVNRIALPVTLPTEALALLEREAADLGIDVGDHVAAICRDQLGGRRGATEPLTAEEYVTPEVQRRLDYLAAIVRVPPAQLLEDYVLQDVMSPWSGFARGIVEATAFESIEEAERAGGVLLAEEARAGLAPQPVTVEIQGGGRHTVEPLVAAT